MCVYIYIYIYIDCLGSFINNLFFSFVQPNISCSSWMICVIGGMWPYNWCFVGYYFQALSKTAYSILL